MLTSNCDKRKILQKPLLQDWPQFIEKCKFIYCLHREHGLSSETIWHKGKPTIFNFQSSTITHLDENLPAASSCGFKQDVWYIHVSPCECLESFLGAALPVNIHPTCSIQVDRTYPTAGNRLLQLPFRIQGVFFIDVWPSLRREDHLGWVKCIIYILYKLI